MLKSKKHKISVCSSRLWKRLKGFTYLEWTTIGMFIAGLIASPCLSITNIFEMPMVWWYRSSARMYVLSRSTIHGGVWVDNRLLSHFTSWKRHWTISEKLSFRVDSLSPAFACSVSLALYHLHWKLINGLEWWQLGMPVRPDKHLPGPSPNYSVRRMSEHRCVKSGHIAGRKAFNVIQKG